MSLPFCDEHQREFKGPNARGNYWHVINFEKGEFCNRPADKPEYTEKMAEKATEIREKLEDKPDRDEIAKGKVRHGVAIAFIERERILTDELVHEMDRWVDYIMSGKL